MKNEALQSELEAEVTPRRDLHGRFAPGCQPGPGRPKYLNRRELCEFFREKVTERDMNEILQDAVERAKDGDYRAREWLFRTVGEAVRQLERMDSYKEYSIPNSRTQ